jgi:DNA repair protein RecN (Recombination protein N)
MLVELRIQNLAVVEDACLTFGPGLNVLTGSTGAGKSLILSAVNLLLGERHSSRMIRQGADRAVIEGEFRLPRPHSGSARPVNRSAEISTHFDGEGHIALRREVRANGRSHAWINDKPATLKELHETCVLLIEPHGQNEQLRLKDPETHIAYVDALAGNARLRENYASALSALNGALTSLREFDARIAVLKEKRELFEHRIAEIDRARIERGEKQALEASLEVMENVQKIAEVLSTAYDAVYDNETSAVSGLALAIKQIARIQSIDEKFADFAEALEGARITLNECAGEMTSYLDNMEFDAERLQRTQERLEFLTGLERRYGKPVDEILEDRIEWGRELDSLTFEEEERAKLQREFERKLSKIKEAAQRLTQSRMNAAKKLDGRITAEMEKLMMSGATFRTVIEREMDAQSPLRLDGRRIRLRPDGIDRVEFYVRTNRGEAEGSLSEIASTGEVSRVALALKKVTRAGAETGTLVFDEIDAGVGADLGEMIAGELRELSKLYQIICITHMPQIAAAGDAHAVVSKKSAGGRAKVSVAPLSGGERLLEIARMLGGREGSKKRLALAEEMLQKEKTAKASARTRP